MSRHFRVASGLIVVLGGSLGIVGCSASDARRPSDVASPVRVDTIVEFVVDTIVELDTIVEFVIVGPSYVDGQVFSDCSSCPQLVVVPAGSYQMGSLQREPGRSPSEGAPQAIEVRSRLAVGVHEVTFAEWDTCAEAGGCGGYLPEDEAWGRLDHPVINVSWSDVQAYVAWLSEETGGRYRLLSEAEWEYVSRAGTLTARYWGESMSTQCEYANGGDGDSPCADGHASTAPVASYQANRFGLYDVLGNVWEWTQDCWTDRPTDRNDARPVDYDDCSRRVVRGGSWADSPDLLRSANRGSYVQGTRTNRVGFRVVRDLGPGARSR